MLTETWGDVPLVLTPSDQATFGYTRTAEQKIYDQIIQDLTEAIDALPVATRPILAGLPKHGTTPAGKVYLTRAINRMPSLPILQKRQNWQRRLLQAPILC